MERFKFGIILPAEFYDETEAAETLKSNAERRGFKPAGSIVVDKRSRLRIRLGEKPAHTAYERGFDFMVYGFFERV